MGTSPVAYWPFNGNPNDSIAAHNGTPNGSPTFVGGLPANSDAAFNCAGVGWVEVAHATALKPAVGSILAWFRPTSAHNGAVISADAVGAVAGDFAMRVFDTGRIRCRFQTATGTNAIIATAEGYYSPNQVVCAVVTFNATGFTLYLGGNVIGTNAEHTTGLNANTTAWRFGNVEDTPSIFNGVIDEFAIWNRVLTRNEIFVLAQTEPD